MPHFQRFVGIDVCKDRLDVHCIPDGRSFCVANSPAGIDQLLAQAGADAAFGCEATGGYEDLLLVQLTRAGAAGYCLHPADIRAFCRLRGKRAKTDALDAKAIADALSVAVVTRKPVLRTEMQSRIKELTALRRSLLATMAELKSLAARMRDSAAANAIDELVAANAKAVKDLNQAIRKTIDEDPGLRLKASRIASAPGAGPVLVAELLGSMPELGTLSSRQVASLAGVAPHPRQSGDSSRNGRCHGGRAKLRRVLYMAAMSVIVPGQTFRSFYDRLRSRGKPHKVAIVAVMRKLVVILNAMLKTGENWKRQLAA